MSKMKKWIALALMATMMLTLAACGGGAKTESKDAKDIKTVQAGKLTVAMECAYPPFNWTQTDDSNGAVAIEGGGGYANGYDVQIAKQVAKALGLELAISKTEWDGLPPAVNSGMVDVIMAGMSPTAERRNAIDFTDAYYNSQLVVVVRADGKYADAKTNKDFKDARITAQLNTFHYTVVDQLKGAQKLEAMESFPVMRTALQSGIIDGYVSEKPEALSASAAIPGFKMIELAEGQGFTFEPDDVNIAAGLKKGNTALLEGINKALKDISQEDRDKIMDEMIQKQPSSEA